MTDSFIYDLLDTWNSPTTQYNAIKINVNDISSSLSSNLMDLQIGGNSRFRIGKEGNVQVSGTLSLQRDYSETVFTQSGNNFTVNLSNGTVHRFTTTANAVVNLPNSIAGKSYTVIVQYGGAHLLGWSGGTNLRWMDSVTPVATAVAGRIDIFTFFCDGINTYGGIFGQNF